MKRNVLILGFTLAVGQGWAQNVEFEKEYFKQNKEGFKEARKKLEEGDDIFGATSKKTDEAYRKAHYRRAIPPYLAAYEFNPNSATLNYRLGVTYLFSEEKTKAASYLEKARKLNPAVHHDLGFYLARAYHMKAQWQKAVSEYKSYLSSLPAGTSTDKAALAQQHVRECLVGEELQKNPTRVFLDNLGPEVNTKFAEYRPVISADETLLVFTSPRPLVPVTSDKKKKDQDPEEKEKEKVTPPNDDIYFAIKENGKWGKVKSAGEFINSEKAESAVCLSPDGQKLVFYREEDGGDLYESALNGNVWDKPENLKDLNSKYKESSASYSYDGKTLFFVSDRPNGQGKADIYFSVLDGKGNWGKPVNAGPDLNTPLDEGSVFLMPDGKTLYFSSEGHSSMGGFDLFKSVLVNGKWSKPENLGFPVNSPDDDLHLSLDASGRFGYLASNHLQGPLESSDLIKVTFLGPEKPMVLLSEDDLLASASKTSAQPVTPVIYEAKTPETLLLHGMVVDAQTNAPLEATVEVSDLAKKEVMATFTANRLNGKYLLSLPYGKNYGVVLSKDNYLFHSENFDLTGAKAFRKEQMDVKLKAPVAGQVLVLRNVLFDKDQSALKPESLPELDRVVQLLKENRSAQAEISSFTAQSGESAPGKNLSEARAKAVTDYLITKGINAKRLQAKGQATTTNETERRDRVEVKLVVK